MEEKGYTVLGEKDKKNTILWFISSLLILIVGIALFLVRVVFNVNLSNSSKMNLSFNIFPFIAITLVGIPFLILSIWDLSRPDNLIMISENKEKIKVFSSSKWKEIEVKDIINVDKKNFHRKYRTLSSGSVYLETRTDTIKIFNLKSVDRVWYEIKEIVDNSKIS